MAGENGLPKVRRLLLDELRIDPRYQRPLRESRVKMITSGFDSRQLGILEVSARSDGWYAVFDGQHRLVALRKRGAKDALCLVHEGLSPEEEAYLFAHLQLDRRPLTPFERFKAQLFAGETAAIEIDQIVRDYDCRLVAGGSSPRAISAIVAVERIYARGGGALLREVLGFVIEIWDGDDGFLKGEFLLGASIFLSAFGPKVGDGQRAKLARHSPWALMRRSISELRFIGRRTADAAGVAVELRKAAGMTRTAPVRYTKLFGSGVRTGPRRRKRGEKATT